MGLNTVQRAQKNALISRVESLESTASIIHKRALEFREAVSVKMTKLEEAGKNTDKAKASVLKLEDAVKSIQLITDEIINLKNHIS